MIKTAVNGTGRIGNAAIKQISQRDDIQLVAINTTQSLDTLIQLLKYDSVHGKYQGELYKIDETTLKIGKDTVKVLSSRDPNNLDFGDAEVVIECTGSLLTTEKAQAFLKNSVKKVVMSAPAKDDTPMYVLNVNTNNYQNEAIISNASCTTNCLAPLVKVLQEKFGIIDGLMTTIHSYTNDQRILDGKHSDIRRARAAAINMIPTTTGAAKAIGKVIPELKGKLNGYAMRVPTVDVSVVDLTVNLSCDVTKEEINQAFTDASENEFKGFIEIDNEQRVSGDFIGSSYSSIFIPDMTQVVNSKTVKILAWYDNEWGYTSRLVDMAVFVGSRA
ncbi:MAG: type I glyceraldehyde-3-phosphate dehydrogenase [Campylobacterales bacterium]|nr:type I glyceraldehyde-3-phosphate dehydrogenase [Campylobacterales bacterium]